MSEDPDATVVRRPAKPAGPAAVLPDPDATALGRSAPGAPQANPIAVATPINASPTQMARSDAAPGETKPASVQPPATDGDAFSAALAFSLALPAHPAAPSPMATLAAHPDRFDLDQAAFVVARGRDPVELPFASVPRLALPLAEVTSVNVETGALASPLFGLIGAGGSLPRHYTATAGAELRKRSLALHAFLDLLARRFTGMWVKAGAKYRPTRDPAPTERALDALIGMGTPGLTDRLAVPGESLRFHAGHLAARTRSAERLRALLAEEAGSAVEIVEFAGGWLRLPPTEQSRLGQAHFRLGVDAAVGAQVWDPQARFIIRLGPLDAATFARLLPGHPLFERLCGLTRLFVGPEQDFVINPILAAGAVPAARAGEGRLGLTSWMSPSRPRTRPAGDAFLQPPPIQDHV